MSGIDVIKFMDASKITAEDVAWMKSLEPSPTRAAEMAIPKLTCDQTMNAQAVIEADRRRKAKAKRSIVQLQRNTKMCNAT